MSILVDKNLKDAIATGTILVDPFDPSLIQPNSLDVRLGNTECRYIAPGYNCVINPADEAPRSVSRQVDKVVIKPGEFILVETMEYFKLPSTIYGEIMGKSSTGRLGIDVENAGLIDSGFEGTLTLELYNKTKSHTYTLPPGFPIAQIVFYPCDEVETPYNMKSTSRYNGQRGATPYRVQTHDTDDRGASSEAYGETTAFGKAIDHFRARKRGKGSGGAKRSSADSGEQDEQSSI